MKWGTSGSNETTTAPRPEPRDASVRSVCVGRTACAVVSSIDSMTSCERNLNSTEIARLLADSDSEESERDSEGDSEEEDCVVELQVVNNEREQEGGPPEQESGDEADDSAFSGRGRIFLTTTRTPLTASEKTLAEADLQPVQQPQETFSVQRRGLATIDWTSEPGNIRRRRISPTSPGKSRG